MSNRLGREAPCVAAAAALALGAGCSDGDAGGSGGSPSTSVPFTLEEALAELPEGPGPLRAVIETEKGTLTCALHPDKAPIGVANFVGLARGRREWKDPRKDEWVKTRFYDGLLFHRVIDDFMAQGGDPLGTGYGGPGYEFANEDSDLRHEPGTLAYANAGRDTNGSQFYITETAQPMLDGDYTIFGSCAPLDVIQAITSTPTGSQDRPLEDLHMLRVEITRTAP
jgi:peptidyl-prolyl cis-trans isomerase A (cyclophilin A)